MEQTLDPGKRTVLQTHATITVYLAQRPRTVCLPLQLQQLYVSKGRHHCRRRMSSKNLMLLVKMVKCEAPPDRLQIVEVMNT